MERNAENVLGDFFTIAAIANDADGYVKSHKPFYGKDQNLLEFDTSLNYFRNDSSFDFNSIKNFSAFSKEFGFASLEEFKRFLNTYSINSNDNSNNNKAIKIDQSTDSLIRKQNDLKLAVLSVYRVYQIALIIFLVLLVVLFPIRYIYYTVKWSISMLKQK